MTKSVTNSVEREMIIKGRREKMAALQVDGTGLQEKSQNTKLPL